MGIPVKRVALSIPTGVLLSLVVAGAALGAHVWSAPIPLTSSGSGFGEGVVGLNATDAVAAYVEWNGNGYDVKVRRSDTSGSSWGSPLTLSTDGYPAAIAGMDPFVDVVWSQNNRVRYARSINGGVSFGASMPISPRGFPLNLSVARGPGGVVAVAWEGGNTNVKKIRVSSDGGVTFGPITNFASSVQDMGTAVAVGDGVVYFAYMTTFHDLKITRSTDNGVSWSTPSSVSNDVFSVVDQFSVTAVDDHASIAFTNRNTAHPAWGTIKYRRTLNGGSSWSSTRQISPAAWKTEFPEIELRGGVVRAVYERRTSSGIDVYYQQSNDGLNWSTAELVATEAHDSDVTLAGNIIVMYIVGTGDTFVRTGS